MNAKIMLNAIGGIRDEHIMEFAEVKSKNIHDTGYIKKMLPFVASLGIVFCVAVGLTELFYLPMTPQDGENITGSSSETESDTGLNIGTESEKVDEPLFDMDKVVWGSGSYNHETDNGEGMESNDNLFGTIQIAPSLENAMTEYVQEVVFAVYVECPYISDKNAIYEEFILKLGVEEDYMEKSVIYATKAQIEAFECPENMGFVLHLANKQEDEEAIE